MGNKIVQLVAQHYCIASWRVNVAHITTPLLHEVEALSTLRNKENVCTWSGNTNNIFSSTCNTTMLRDKLHNFVARITKTLVLISTKWCIVLVEYKFYIQQSTPLPQVSIVQHQDHLKRKYNARENIMQQLVVLTYLY